MTVLITLTFAEADLGPFDLYTSSDSFTTPIETNVSKASLLAGFPSINVPDNATVIRCKSLGVCTNFIDIPIETPIYEIAGCRSDYSFFALGNIPFLVGDVVYFNSNNPLFTDLYCGTIITISNVGAVDITLTGLQPTLACADVGCGDDFDIIP